MDLFSHISEGQESKVKVLVGLCFPQSSRGDFVPCLFQLLAAVNIPGSAGASFQQLSLSSHVLPLCLSPLCVSWELLSLDLGPTQIIQDDLISRC